MAVTIPSTFLAFGDRVLRSTDFRCCIECASVEICLPVFQIALGSGFVLGGRSQGKVSISSHQVEVTYMNIHTLLLMLTLITWLRWCSSGFSMVRLFPFPHFPMWYSKEVTLHASCLRNGESCLPAWGQCLRKKIAWNLSAWKMSPRPCLYVHPAIHCSVWA